MNEMTFNEFRADLAGALNAVEHRGETVIVTRRGKPAAMLVPYTSQESTMRTITLISATSGDHVTGVELGDPASRVEFHELPKAAQDWAREQGYGTDESELVYVLDDGEAVPAGFPVFVVEKAAITTAAQWADALDAMINRPGQTAGDLIGFGYANGELAGVTLDPEHPDADDERGVVVSDSGWVVGYDAQSGYWRAR
jgi:prevent-host-death family protein